MVNDTWKWIIRGSELKMMYSVNECFGSLYLDQGKMLVKKLVVYSCIIYSSIQCIDVEQR
jgi:hypothetical protein